MRKNSEKCLICGKSGFKNANGFTKHLRVHKISAEKYYLFYIDYTAGICKVCGKSVKFSSIDEGFPKLCWNCHNKDPEKFKKARATLKNKFGFENPSQIEQFKEKRKQTNLERYGVEHAMSNSEIFNRCVETWKKNYEEGHPLRDSEVKRKIIKTVTSKYGVQNVSQIPEVRNIVREKISGENHYLWNPNREEINRRYGKEFFDQEFRERIKEEQKNLDPLTGETLNRLSQLHHVDYDKSNNSRENLIYLNIKSHKMVHRTNREHWMKVLTKINEAFT